MEETYLSGRSTDEGDDHGCDGMRWDMVPKAVGQTQPLIHTNWKFLEDKALSNMGCQSKGGFSFLNVAKRVQGGSKGGVALVVVNQVNEACKVFQKLLANLMEGAHGCNFLVAGLKQGEAQSAKSGTVSKEVNVRGPMSGSKGGTTNLRCGKE